MPSKKIITSNKILYTALIALFMILQTKIWDRDVGLPNVLKLKTEQTVALNEKENIAAQNAIIANKINGLSGGDIDRIAREDLGMIGKDEIYMQLK